MIEKAAIRGQGHRAAAFIPYFGQKAGATNEVFFEEAFCGHLYIAYRWHNLYVPFLKQYIA